MPVAAASKRIGLDASVVVATWNNSNTITRAIKSALDQLSVELEVIVVDDNSSDGTGERVVELSDSRVKYYSLRTRLGASYARNFGISRSKGDWIVILDADDAMHPKRLLKMIELARAERADCAIDQIEAVDEAGRKIVDFVQPFKPGPLDLNTYIRGNILFGSAGLGYLKPILRRRFLLERNLHYKLDLKIGEDFALVTDVLLSKGRVLLTSGADYIYTRRQNSLSSRSTSEDIRRMISYDDYLSQHQTFLECQTLQSSINDHRAALYKLLCHTNIAESFYSGHFIKFMSLIITERETIPFLWSVICRRAERYAHLLGSR
jgi:succinoglycan biosynthesis protein ExoO